MAQVIPFPGRARRHSIEIWEAADRSGWLVTIAPTPPLASFEGKFSTRDEAVAYADGLHNGTGWTVLDWETYPADGAA
jgi:hypothetical protein